MVEQSNKNNDNLQAIKEHLALLGDVQNQDLDAWCEEALKNVLGLYQGKRSKLLLKLITDDIKPAKQFDPEPQPQDTGDLLAELISLFLAEVNEISEVINTINKESVVLHSVKSAETEIKQELMKIMLAKQKEIMVKYGLQADD